MNKTALIKLQREWYGKLKQSGFEDIEYLVDGYGVADFIKKPSGIFKKMSYDDFTATESYYILARQFLHHYQFPTDRDQFIWSQHADGCSSRCIAKSVKTTHSTILKVINHFKEVMFKGEWK
jgi:FixJ family two-component response regulator